MIRRHLDNIFLTKRPVLVSESVYVSVCERVSYEGVLCEDVLQGCKCKGVYERVSYKGVCERLCYERVCEGAYETLYVGGCRWMTYLRAFSAASRAGIASARSVSQEVFSSLAPSAILLHSAASAPTMTDCKFIHSFIVTTRGKVRKV